MSADLAWLSGTPGQWRVSLWAQAGASRTEVAGEHLGRLKLRVAARPIEGQANEALRRWLADRLDLGKQAVTLVAGQSGRRKAFEVRCTLSAAELAARLLGR